MPGAQGQPRWPVQYWHGVRSRLSARTAAYWVVREERTRSGNAADGRSWTG